MAVVERSDCRTDSQTLPCIRAPPGANLNNGEGRLLNLSFRGWCPSQGDLTSGFVIEGSGSRRLLIRGVGPGLKQYGISRALGDPCLQLMDARGQALAANDDWSYGGVRRELQRLLLDTGSSNMIRPGSRDAALTLNLAPGVYTVVLRSAAPQQAGVAMIELIDLGAGESEL